MLVVLGPDRLLRRIQKRAHGKRSHRDKQQSDKEADVAEAAPGRVPGGDAPLGREQPQAVGEVPGSAEDPNSVKRYGPGVLKFQLHFAEGCVGMSQDVNPAEAQVPGVPHDVAEGDGAGPALESEHPVAGPGIVADVTLATEPDVEAVKRVIKDRQPDSEQFEVENEREAGEQFYLLGVCGRTTGGEGVGDEVFDQERAYRDDAAQRMKLAE